MARNIDDIQREIERTRRQLAKTLDEIADRAKPQNIVEDAKTNFSAKLKQPEVQKIVMGVGTVVVGLIAVGVLRSRKRRKDLKELQQLLAAR
ncbi:DUF3618 domain-containing protein [Corynebacterium mustelae]|uniref:DUF3618 domain-containing protein n=1 Tax=Corynebacterium mustelae TaxID=571915 RepID=UPI000640DFF4|nr:DUF3618 domain-containing protein [Corynebacterium mustelae]